MKNRSGHPPISIQQMRERHLGKETWKSLLVNAFARYPARFTLGFAEGLYMWNNGSFLTYPETQPGEPGENYLLGRPPYSSLSHYLGWLDSSVGEDRRGLVVVAPTCMQSCLENRIRLEGGHPLDGKTECGNEEGCAYNSIATIIDSHNAKHQGNPVMLHHLARTSQMTQEVMVPYLIAPEKGIQPKRTTMYYVCDRTEQRLPLAGAQAVARAMGHFIIVSIVEGQTCNDKQFYQVESSGKIPDEVLTRPTNSGLDLLRKILAPWEPAYQFTSS